MTKPDSYQDQHALTKAQERKGDDLKKQSRRNWLRTAAMAATGAVVLPSILTGCTKEQWDDAIDKVPGGGLGSEPDLYYYLKATYLPDINWAESKVGYIEALEGEGSYLVMSQTKNGGSGVRLHPAQNGYNYLQFRDNSWMSLSYAGWAYKSSQEERVGWKIVDGKMYTDYNRWKDYPLGCEKRHDFFYNWYYYIGANVGWYDAPHRIPLYQLRDCKFEPFDK